MMIIQPIATIQLDTPDSSDTVRGVVAWNREAGTVVVFDPSSPDLWSVEEDGIGTLLHALEAIDSMWGEGYLKPDDRVWRLQWLCDDPEDYDDPDA